MGKIKSIIKVMSDMAYTVSLAVIGSLSLEDETFSLPIYQIMVTIYIVCGVIKYENDGFTKELAKDMSKDLITSLLTVFVLLKITSYKDYSAINSISIVLMHNIVLLIIFYLIYRSEKNYGKVAFFSWPIFFVLALIFIKLGLSIIISVIIAVVLIQPLNYYGYREKNKKLKG
jgi:hypothetical protein